MHKLFNNVNVDYHQFLIVKSYKKNQTIFNEHEMCKSVGLVLKGQVQISTYVYYDKEYNIVNLYENESFGHTLIFSSKPYYLGNVISIKDTDVAYIEKQNLIYLLQQDQGFLENYLRISADKSLYAQQRIRLLMQKTIRDKILFYLANQAKLNNTKIIPIQSKETLAQLLNIPRPSLSRELKLLKNDNIIDYNRKTILLKTAKFHL